MDPFTCTDCGKTKSCAYVYAGIVEPSAIMFCYLLVRRAGWLLGCYVGQVSLFVDYTNETWDTSCNVGVQL